MVPTVGAISRFAHCSPTGSEVCTVPAARTSVLVPAPPVIVVVPLQASSVNVSLLGPPVNWAVVTLSRVIVSVPLTLLPLIVRLESLSV